MTILSRLMSELKNRIPIKAIISAGLSAMLLFSAFINPAVSYQQAMTSTSENVFSIGENLSANLNVIKDTSIVNQIIYPNEFISFEPVIENTSEVPVWTILAVKIPAIQNGNNVMPAFYSTLFKNSIPEQIESDLLYCKESDDFATGWTLLEVNREYAYSENGYFIYYFGYDIPLKAHEIATSPFDGFMSADIKNISTDLSSNIPTGKEFYTNMSIESRLFIIQEEAGIEGSNYHVTNAWNNTKNKFSVFGGTSIINAAFYSAYTAGKHTVEFKITKDIQEIQITNISTKKSEVIAINNNPDVTTGEVDHNGVYSAFININFQDSGVYEAAARSDSGSEFINSVNFGYITIT